MYMAEDETKKRLVKSQATSSIDKAIKGAVKFNLEDCRRRERQESDLDAMVLTCQEFMKSFIIIGYDMDGDAIPPIVVANSQQEADSLTCYLNKLTFHGVKNISTDEDETD